MSSSAASAHLSRSANACESCRRRKVKCSGQQPCQSCIRQRTECRFGNAGRRGYSESYVQGLLATIQAQEKKLKEKPSVSPQDSGSHHGISPIESSAVELQTRMISDPATESLAVSPVTELASGPAFESRVRSLLRDHAEGSRNTHTSPEDSLDSIIASSSPKNDPSPGQWKTTKELVEGVPCPNLMSKDRSYQLFEEFVGLMGINQHFIDPRNFSDSLTLLYQSEHSRNKQMETMWFTEYLLIMAMGMLIGSPSHGSQNPPGNEYFAKALKRLPPMHQLGAHGIISVEILCLITLYLQWCDRKHDAYLYIGAAMRLAIALGCSLPYDEQEGLPSEICHRVRVWWTAYMLDRRLSAGLGFPMAVDDRQLRADLPRPSAGFQPPLPMVINIRIARATGEIMTSFYGNTPITQGELVQKIQSTLLNLYETGRSIPDTLAVNFQQPDIKVSRTGASLYLMLFQAMILCIRPVLLQSVKDKVEFARANPSQPPSVAPIIARLCHSCQEAAAKSIQILSSLQKQKTIALFGFFDLDATFSAAFVLLMMGFVKSNDPEHPPEGLEQAFEVLRYLSNAGNKSAEQRMNDLKQFCFHVWSPDKMPDKWKWLEHPDEQTLDDLANSILATNATQENERTGVLDGQAFNPSDLQSFWPEGWAGWFGETKSPTAIGDLNNPMLSFDAAGDFQIDLNPEANEIYSSFNDPNLPLTGVDEMDWAEMEKIFRA